MKLLRWHTGAALKKLPEYQNKKEKVSILKPDDPIFRDIDGDEIYLLEKHQFHVHRLPDNFEVLGSSDVCPYEIIKHKEKPIYGFQSHPEASGKLGLKIVENFLHLCGISLQ